MRLAARVSRSCCCALHRQQQRCRGGGGGTNCNAAAVAVVARALTFSQPLPRGGARSHRISSLLRLEAVLERPVMTSCRSGSGDQSSNNRGGIAASSSSPSDDAAAAAAANAVDDDDNKPLVSPPPQNDDYNNKRTRRMRLDEAASLVAGSSVSRTVIQSWIARGKVFVDGVPVTKAGHSVPPRAAVEVRASEERFVCRGGLKLDAALRNFGVDVRGMRAIDCGLSTGGFADRLLQGGVEAVLGVDVGYGKKKSFFFAFFAFRSRISLSLGVLFSFSSLAITRQKTRVFHGENKSRKIKIKNSGQVAEKVRIDPRLFSLERTNARRLTAAMLPRGAPRSYDIATLDVSFISVLKVRGKRGRRERRESKGKKVF